MDGMTRGDRQQLQNMIWARACNDHTEGDVGCMASKRGNRDMG